jgi:hypothetical protein
MITLYQEFSQDLTKHDVLLILDTEEFKRMYTIEDVDKLSLPEALTRIGDALKHLQEGTYPE